MLTRAHQGEAERRSGSFFRRHRGVGARSAARERERKRGEEGNKRERRFVMRDVGGLVKILQPSTKSAFESHTIIRPVCLFLKTLNQHGSGRVIKVPCNLMQRDGITT